LPSQGDSRQSQETSSATRTLHSHIVVGVECLYCWYGVSDFYEDLGVDFILGHALYMKAIHGGIVNNDAPHRRENGVPSRWHQCHELLLHKRVPHKAQRWYVLHVETFLKTDQPDSLSQLTAMQVTDYFQQASHNGQHQEWQFRRLVDAIQLLEEHREGTVRSIPRDSAYCCRL